MNFGSLFKIVKTIAVWIAMLYVATLSVFGLGQMLHDFKSWALKTNEK